MLNMYVMHCILSASERTYFRIYGALQITIIIIIIFIYDVGHAAKTPHNIFNVKVLYFRLIQIKNYIFFCISFDIDI